MGRDKTFIKFRFTTLNGKGIIEGINFDKYDDFKEGFINRFGKESFLKLIDDGYANFNMDIIYYPTINEYKGNRTVQLNIKNLRIQ